MNPSKESEVLGLLKQVDLKDTIIAPSFAHLSLVQKKIKKAKLAAQDMSAENPQNTAASTGEISASMLKNIGVKYVIIGHSERRGMGDTDALISSKIKLCLKEKMLPILCVGEGVRDHDMFYYNSVKTQLLEDLKNVSRVDLKKVIIAYEPVWAIGNSAKREATPEECQEMVIFIKKVISDKFGSKSLNDIKIIYGGSVNPKNAADFLTVGGADGLLVGRSSLDPKKFYEIYQTTQNG